jgi:Flp pilus assembly protein TadD
LAIGLSACAGGTANSPVGKDADAKSAMLLKIADETYSGGDPATAASLYRQLHEQQPKDPVPLERMAAIFMTLQDYRSAIDAYRAALVLDPDNANIHRQIAIALLVMGDGENAMTEIRAALAKHADDPRLYNLMGVAQDMAGRHDLAQQSYRHGTEIAPANVGLRNNYAMSLAMSGNFADAVAELHQIAGLNAPPRYRLNLALAYGLSGDDVHAAETARQVLDEASVQNNLAYYALLRGMDPAHRTAAIVGAELHGTPVTADAALKPQNAIAEAQPVAAPAPAPVAQAALPPLLPEATPLPADPAPKPRPTAAATPDASPARIAATDQPPPAAAAKPAAPARHVAALVPAPANDDPPPAAAPSDGPSAPPTAEAPKPSPAARHVAARADHSVAKTEMPAPAAVPPAPPAAEAAKPSEASSEAAALADPSPAAKDNPASAAMPPAAPPTPAAAPKPSDASGNVAALADPPVQPKDTPAPAAVPPAPAAPEAASQPPQNLVPPPAQAVLTPAPEKPSDTPPADSGDKPAEMPKLPGTVGPSSANGVGEGDAVTAAAPADVALDAQVNAWLDRNAAALQPPPKADPPAAAQALHAVLDRYTVQLGSFVYEASAHRLADAFAAKSIVVTISQAPDRDGREWYVTRAGEFTTPDDAADALHMIQSMGGAEPIVVKHKIGAEPKPAA